MHRCDAQRSVHHSLEHHLFATCRSTAFEHHRYAIIQRCYFDRRKWDLGIHLGRYAGRCIGMKSQDRALPWQGTRTFPVLKISGENVDGTVVLGYQCTPAKKPIATEILWSPRSAGIGSVSRFRCIRKTLRAVAVVSFAFLFWWPCDKNSDGTLLLPDARVV